MLNVLIHLGDVRSGFLIARSHANNSRELPWRSDELFEVHCNVLPRWSDVNARLGGARMLLRVRHVVETRADEEEEDEEENEEEVVRLSAVLSR